jgi:hypothetical protein
MTQKLLPYNIVILSLNPSYNDVPFPGSMVAKASALFFFSNMCVRDIWGFFGDK